MFDITVSDLVTIALLVALEGILSADNAMVLAVRVLSLPRHMQQKALRYGMASAFTFRALATALAAYLLHLGWVKLVGGLYLLYLPYQHFFGHASAEERQKIKPAEPWLGLPPFWATVVKVELTDIVFAIDSILVAVAVSNKLWVVITGGILGIVMMRMLIGTPAGRHPALPAAGGRRLRHHHLGRTQAADRVRPRRGMGALRDPEVAVAGVDRRDLRDYVRGWRGGRDRSRTRSRSGA